jgi:hypothetical protein
MIDRQGLKILFGCDSCDEIFESEDREEFTSAWDRAKRGGWKAKKIGEEWVHGRPQCGV